LFRSKIGAGLKFARKVVRVVAVVSAAAVALLVSALLYFPAPNSERLDSVSQLVIAENGELLRGYLTPDGRWRLATNPEDVDHRYIDALLAYEDRRFYSHWGVDLHAIARVASQILLTGRAESGASTLTMQAVRLLEPGSSGLYGKIKQLIGAIQLEHNLTKHDILKVYLTLAPFGGNIEGVRAASLHYFGHEPNTLTSEEAALLIALAQAPTRRRPDRHPLVAADARDRILTRLAGRVNTMMDNSPKTDGQQARVGSRPFHAPHLADRARVHQTGTVRTMIDAPLQVKIESMVSEALQSWPQEVNAAVLVIRNSDSAVRAYVGGADFFSQGYAGQFDHVRAVRSPGSTLKPMIYGLGFEALIIHPSSIVRDGPVNFDGYTPQNFDQGYQGDMTVREALVKSINTTAVAVLSRVTPAVLLTRLRSADLAIEIDDLDTSAGLAVALGGGGMTLENLTRLYAGFANHGVVRPLKILASEEKQEGKPLLGRDVTWALADILAEVPPPDGFGQRHSLDGGRRIAYKTGTSFGYRDAWSIGFDKSYTVGVWIGRSDAAPNPGATGITAAAPLLYRIFDLLPTPNEDVAGPPSYGNVLASNLNIPDRLRRWNGTPGVHANHPLRIIFPNNGSIITIGKDTDPEGQTFIPLVADGGEPPYFWFIDNVLLPENDARIRWYPKEAGPVSASVMDGAGTTSQAEFWIQ
jgi:penicillin-binding protein 1C